jgi:hypothetical protein
LLKGIEAELYRFPAVDPGILSAAVESLGSAGSDDQGEKSDPGKG